MTGGTLSGDDNTVTALLSFDSGFLTHLRGKMESFCMQKGAASGQKHLPGAAPLQPNPIGQKAPEPFWGPGAFAIASL